MIPVSTQQHLQILKQRFPRQPSMDEGCYTHSSSTSNTSSSGSGNGNGSKFKMSAALTQAMVTAAMPLARPAPASAPGETQECAHVALEALARRTHAHKAAASCKRNTHCYQVNFLALKKGSLHIFQCVVTPLMVKLHIWAILPLKGSRKNQCGNFDLSLEKVFT